MFSKLSEWFEFHIAVLERKKQPFSFGYPVY